ncbi:MAG: type II toxin-antitoxin system VapC family toxin [Pseudomonadota bacterium]
MVYLLDSCVLIDYSRGHIGAADFLDSLQSPPVISVLTLTEVLSGVRNIKEERLFEKLFSTIEAIPVDTVIAHLASEYLRQYRRSHNLDPFDAVIGATAQSHDAELATLNIKHFPMISRLEQPYVP